MKLRETWGSRLGFIMATAGSAVGLGSLWKFPYVTGENGGGAFVIAYLLFTVFIGLPIFMAELAIGRKSAASPTHAFTTLNVQRKGWRTLGWTSVVAPLLVLSFYSVVAGWSLAYAFMSLLGFSQGKSSEEIRGIFEVLYGSAQINLLWTFAFIALTTAVVHKGIRKGIERWSKILMPALFLLLLLLFLYGTTLPGFKQALTFVFYPDFSKLSASGLLEALGLAFFTLSVGMGILITYGSYMHKEDDIPKTGATIALVNLFVSLVAAMMIFPIIFTFDFPSAEGPGLLFKTLPVLFAKLPGALLISTVFFALVVFAALTSTISIMEVLVATAIEEFNWSRTKAAYLVGGFVFVLAIPSALAGSHTLFKNWDFLYGKTFFETIDNFAFNILLPLNALFTALFTGWALNKNLRKNAFCDGSSWVYTFRPWVFLVKWIVPLAVILIILHEGGLLHIDTLFAK